MEDKRYEWCLTLLFFCTWGVIFLDRLTVSYASDALYAAFHLTNTQYSALSTINGVTFATASIFGGMLSDRLGLCKWLLTPATAFGGLASLCCALFAETYTHLAIARGLIGLATGANLTLMLTLLRRASESHFGRNSGIVNAGPPVLAYICGPLIMTRLTTYLGWRYCYTLSGILLLAVAVATGLLARELPRDWRKRAKGERGGVFRIFLVRNYVLGVVCGLCIMCVYWTVNLYATTFMTKTLQMSAIRMGYVATGMGVLACVYALLVPAASKRFGHKWTIAAALLFSALAPLAMGLFERPLLAMTPYVLFGGVCGSLTPVWASMIPMETLPEGLKATGGGVAYGISEIISGAVWPVVAGAITDATEIRVTLLLSVGIAALGIVACLFLSEEGRGAALPSV